MGWQFLQEQTDSFAATKLAYSNGNVFAGSASGIIRVYDYWHNEYLSDVDFISAGTQERVLPVVQMINIGSAVVNMKEWFDHLYVKTSTELKKINVESKLVVATYTLPHTFTSTMCTAGGKVWFLEKEPADFETTRKSKLHWFDIVTEAWGSTVIPVSFSTEAQELVNGLLGKVILTSYATDSILEFDFLTGEYIRSRAILPRVIHTSNTTQDGKLYITTAQNCMVEYDIPTDAVNGFASTKGAPTILADDSLGALWQFNSANSIGRLNKTTKSYRFVPASGEAAAVGYTLSLGTAAVADAIITPQFAYEVWNGTAFVQKLVKPYLVYIQSSKVRAARLGSMLRVNNTTIRSGAMITVGPNDFRGD